MSRLLDEAEAHLEAREATIKFLRGRITGLEAQIEEAEARRQALDAQCKEYEEGNRFLRAEIARIERLDTATREALVLCRRWIYEAPDHTWGYEDNNKSRARKNLALNEINLVLTTYADPPKPANGEDERIAKLLTDLQAAADNIAFLKEELAVSVRRLAKGSESGA